MDNYLGELRVFAFGQIPRDWAPCNGQLLRIDQNGDLSTLLGTTYGGDGITTFALPDLRGRAMVNFDAADTDYKIGNAGGAERVTLEATGLPAHSHIFRVVSGKGRARLSPSAPGVNYLATAPQTPDASDENIQTFIPTLSAEQTTLHLNSVAPAGGSEPHENRMPHLPMLTCIALRGRIPQKP
ncbi:MAG: tail fiber protein [Chitinophagaceae bacterium]